MMPMLGLSSRPIIFRTREWMVSMMSSMTPSNFFNYPTHKVELYPGDLV